MLNTNFGIEIEFTGITRKQAAEKAAEFLGGTYSHTGTYYDTYTVTAPDGREWKFMSDASINCQKKKNGRKVSADRSYSVEMVSPILSYNEDIETLQELIRQLRHISAFTNSSCGIHIHINGANHTPQTIRNFINIIASRNDLFYKALQIKPERARFCKRMDEHLVETMNRRKPKTMKEIEDIWYEGYYGSRTLRYHDSRYHFLNLHSFFNGHHTIELRGFNSELHAGKVRSYVVLALALNHQALTQKSASSKKPQTENERFAMRTYLNRIGFIGEEFKNCREHLTAHLDGSAAWRYGNPVQNLRAAKAVLKAVEAVFQKSRLLGKEENTMTTKIYGAYGSNINLKQMEIRCPFAEVYGIDRIENYRLTFRRGGYANIEKSEGGSVPVLLWKITERCEESLNVYEGYPRFYIKENITVLTDGGEEIDAMFYVMNEDARGDFELPKPYYYFGIEEGCRVNGIPTGTLEDVLERCRAEVRNKRSSKN